MAIITVQRSPVSTPNRSSTNNVVQLDRNGFNWGPWSISERRVVYDYVNTWIHVHGLDAFCTKKWPLGDFVFLADKINEINATNREDVAPRSYTGVRMEICALGQGRLGPLFKLAKRSEAFVRKIKAGEVIEKDARFPKMAIPVPTVVHGMYATENKKEKEGDRKRVVDDSEMKTAAFGEEAKKQKLEESDSEQCMPKSPAAKEQKKEQVIKLSVDWARLHIRMDGQMAVLEDGEVYKSPLEDSEV